MSKKWRNVIIVLVVIAGLVIAAWWIFTGSLEKRIVSEVHELGFDLKYDDLDFAIWDPGVEFENIQMSIAESDSLLRLNLKELQIEVNWPDVWDGKWTHWSSIKLEGGDISALSLDSLTDIFEVREEVEKKIGIEIDKYEVSNVQLKIDNFSALVGSLNGSLSAECVDRQWNCRIIEEPVEFSISDILVESWIPYHDAKIELVRFNMDSKKMSCEGVAIVPNQTPEYLDANEPAMIVHTSVTIPEIEFINIDMQYRGFLRWIAQSVHIKQPAFSMYQNVTKIFPEKKKELPPAWIDSIGTQFLVDTLYCSAGRLDYTVKKNGQSDNGRLFMDQWELVCTGYGNDSTRPDNFQIAASMNWMEGIEMNIVVVFPYEDPMYGFEMKGEIGNLHFAELNPIFEPVENFYFTDGYTSGIKFSFTGNDRVSNGVLRMSYKDVQIAFTNKPRFIEKLLSWGANSFVLDRAKNGETTEGIIHFERVQNKAVTNFWWKSLESGLIDALRK